MFTEFWWGWLFGIVTVTAGLGILVFTRVWQDRKLRRHVRQARMWPDDDDND